MHVGSLPDHTKGFDANTTISKDSAAMFVLHGYRFAVRYVRRHQPHAYDLTSGEALGILGAGLGLMVVQHVANEGWTPTPDDGVLYGSTAARESHEAGIPSGVTLWCDLEGVAGHVPHADTIGYCNAWYHEVKRSGYVPGLYVGDSCGLSAAELYQALRFSAYWGAYNLNADTIPIVRGLQMRQHVAKPSDLIPGFTNQTMDVDVIHADAKGGTPSLVLP